MDTPASNYDADTYTWLGFMWPLSYMIDLSLIYLLFFDSKPLFPLLCCCCKSGPTDLQHYAQVHSPSLPPAHSPGADTATHIADTITLAAGTATGDSTAMYGA